MSKCLPNSKLLVALSLLIFIFNIVSYGAKANNNNVTSVGSGYVWEPRLHLRLCFSFFFFFFFFFMRLWELWLLFMHCAWTVATKFDFSYLFQSISAHHALFMDPQISFFSNFFIKNGSQVLFTYLKIILLQYFSIFSFSFQFSAVSKRTLNHWCLYSYWKRRDHSNGNFSWKPMKHKCVLEFGCECGCKYGCRTRQFLKK